MTLSNANNSYTGATFITMGTLIAGGNVLITGGSSSGVFGTSAGAITIGDANSGGNPAGLVRNGAYEIDREITVNGGTFSPGPVTLGTIGTGTSTYTGVIVLNSGNSVTLMRGGGRFGAVQRQPQRQRRHHRGGHRQRQREPGEHQQLHGRHDGEQRPVDAGLQLFPELQPNRRPFGGGDCSARLAGHLERRHIELQARPEFSGQRDVRVDHGGGFRLVGDGQQRAGRDREPEPDHARGVSWTCPSTPRSLRPATRASPRATSWAVT